MTEQVPSNQSDTTERYYADMEHARAYHEDEYFRARPNLQRNAPETMLFRAGFERGFKFLWQRFLDAEADMLRLHKELVDLKYPGTVPAPETAPVHQHQVPLGGYICVHCGADLSKHPTSASAHVCQR